MSVRLIWIGAVLAANAAAGVSLHINAKKAYPHTRISWQEGIVTVLVMGVMGSLIFLLIWLRSLTSPEG